MSLNGVKGLDILLPSLFKMKFLNIYPNVVNYKHYTNPVVDRVSSRYIPYNSIYLIIY